MDERTKIAASTGRIALIAAAALEEMLSAEKRDTKAARDLSGIMKDMLALGKELKTDKARENITVRFEGDAGDCSV